MAKNEVHTEIYKGYVINIYQDMDTESPKDWGNDDICGWSKHFTVDNKHINQGVFGALMGFEGFEEFKSEAKIVSKKFHIFGVDAYVHSGIALSLHGEGMRDRWDTSEYVGCVLVEKKETKSRKMAEKIAKGIVGTWNEYLNGEVYGFTISKRATCPTCKHINEEMIDSLWGIYGDYRDNALVEAKSYIDAMK